MNTSSRILRDDELASVGPVWWREANESPGAIRSEPIPAEVAHARNTDGENERAAQEFYQRGFSEGRGAGIEQAQAELRVVLERLTRSLAELSTLRSRIRKDAEGDLLKLSVAVAKKVLHRELTLDPESIGGLIRVALEKLDSREVSRVRVHPDQEHAVRSSMTRFAGAHGVEVVADLTLQCGDVLFETPQGILDASVDAQLREIERGFADRLRR